MAFDIHQLDDLEDRDDAAMEAFLDELLELFCESPEGQAYQQIVPDMGFWVGRLIDYGYIYCGATLPQMDVDDVEELLSDIFPRKITIGSPDETADALPELLAFWTYVQREYQLPQAESILRYLRDLSPATFHAWMMDPTRFGMAKSFMMGGRTAGFDMRDPHEHAAYANLYNATAMAQESDVSLPRAVGRSPQATAKARRQRKLAKASRKKNRKRK